jgi:hypothetical protein
MKQQWIEGTIAIIINNREGKFLLSTIKLHPWIKLNFGK